MRDWEEMSGCPTTHDDDFLRLSNGIEDMLDMVIAIYLCGFNK